VGAERTRRTLRLGSGIAALLLAWTGLPAQGPSLSVAVGSGINSFSATPCEGCIPFQFLPHARLALGFRGKHSVGTEFAFARSRLSPLFSHDEELRERHERLKIFYRSDFTMEETGTLSVGPDIFCQWGRSRYSKTGDGQIAYSGSLLQEYSFLGAGMALEKTFWRFLEVGCDAAYLHQLTRKRNGGLLRSDGGEPGQPADVENAGSLSHLEIGIHARLQFDFPM
jgi:hypothetical protein